MVCSNTWAECLTSPAAEPELSVFLCAIELTCSLDAEVSSREAACSEVACARDCEDDETRPAALPIWLAPDRTESAMCLSIPVTPRTTHSPIKHMPMVRAIRGIAKARA